MCPVKIMLSTLATTRKAIRRRDLFWMSLILSEGFTAILITAHGLLRRGSVDADLLLIGSLDAFVVALFVSSMAMLLLQQSRNHERHTEDAILLAKKELELTFDSMTDLIMILDRKYKVVRTNKAMAEKLKLTPAATVGITCYEHVHGFAEPPSYCPHSQCLSDGQEHSVEIYEEGLGGHYLVTVTPLMNAKGEVVGSVHTARDITERKRTEAAMHEANAALKRQLQFTETLLRAIPMAVFFKDSEGRYLGCNEEFTKIMGVTSQDIWGKTVFDLWPGEQSEMYHRKDLELLQNPEHQSYEFKVTDCEETIIDVMFHKDVFMDENGHVAGIIGAFLDISDRKRAEVKLRETNTMLQALIQAIPDVIFFKDAQNRYLLANKAAEEFMGISQAQLSGKADEELLPRDLAEHCRKSDEAVAKTLGVVHFEEQYAHARTQIFLDTIKAPVFDERGKLAGLVGVSRDITGRKKAEQVLQEKTRQLEDLTRDLEKRVTEEITVRIKNERMMIRQSKLAAMGEMLGAIAHQWRQPLNVVGLIVQRMEEAHAHGKLDKKYLEDMVEKSMTQIKRMSRTIDDFRNFYKPDKEKTVFDAMRAVGDVLSLVSAQLTADNIAYRLTCHTHGITAEKEADVVLCAEKAIRGFRNEFEHVILNLVNNSRDAINERNARGGPGAAENGFLSFDFYHAEDKVTIKVCDNGGGIAPEAMGSIFDPYFTTKDLTMGTGLGLYMSKVIVEEHMQGKLYADNAEGGAIFTIELPSPGKEVDHECAGAT